MLSSFKQLMTIAGRGISEKWLARLRATLNYLEIGHRMARQGYAFPGRVARRQDVWESVARQISARQVLYLEFGVAQGESIRFWSKALKHPGSLIHGFDSFEGLPEGGGHWKKGQFSTGGTPPQIDDHRVAFFKGWFDQVMPTYTVPAHELLVINLDADLYSSTIFVLRYLRPHLRKGTFIYFDDMNHPEHEMRALEEFTEEANIKLRPVCGDKSLTHVFFECVEAPR